jgi:hypothetical protein
MLLHLHWAWVCARGACVSCVCEFHWNHWMFPQRQRFACVCCSLTSLTAILMHHIAGFVFVHSFCIIYLCDSPFLLFDAKGGSIKFRYFLHHYWFGSPDASLFVIQCFISYCILSVCIVDGDVKLLHFWLTGVSMVRAGQRVSSVLLYFFSVEIINICRVSKQK